MCDIFCGWAKISVSIVIKILKKFVELKETFSMFDIDGSGHISIQELTAVLKSLGKDLSDEDIKEMHEIADKDGTCINLVFFPCQ